MLRTWYSKAKFLARVVQEDGVIVEPFDCFDVSCQKELCRLVPWALAKFMC
jgi:hypothetical protein